MVGRTARRVFLCSSATCAILVVIGLAIRFGNRNTEGERGTGQRQVQIALGATRSDVEKQHGQPSHIVGTRFYYRIYDSLRPGESPRHPRYLIVSYDQDVVTSIVLRSIPAGLGSDKDEFWGGSRDAWFAGAAGREMRGESAR